jgi:ABC-type sulfate transport system permease component
VLLAGVVLATVFFVVPLVGMLGRVPWGRLAEVLGRPAVLEALGLTLAITVLATAAA